MPARVATRSTRRASGARFVTCASADDGLFGSKPNGSTPGWNDTPGGPKTGRSAHDMSHDLLHIGDGDDGRLFGRPREQRRVSLPGLLTVDEVADLLRTTRRAIYAMIERRQLPGVIRIRRRVLLRADDLLDWLDQKRAPSPEE